MPERVHVHLEELAIAVRAVAIPNVSVSDAPKSSYLQLACSRKPKEVMSSLVKSFEVTANVLWHLKDAETLST